MEMWSWVQDADRSQGFDSKTNETHVRRSSRSHERRFHFTGPSAFVQLRRRVSSEAGGRQDVHVSGFELVWSRSLTSTLHRGDLHLGRGHRLSCGGVDQPRRLGLHHLHGGRLLGTAVRLQRKACWEKRKEDTFSECGIRNCKIMNRFQ